VKELGDVAIARHARHGAALPTMDSTMHLYAIDAAAHRVGKNDTVFSYRDANWAEVIVGVDRTRQMPARSRSAARTTSTPCIRIQRAARPSNLERFS
jgi:hypothetical protein